MGDLLGSAIEDVGTVPICGRCGSERVVLQAFACWNREFGLWELETTGDAARCHACEGRTDLVWQPSDANKPVKRVTELNDLFRTTLEGHGTVLITRGIEALGPDAMRSIAATVRGFSDFPPESDPWGEHDFGAFDVGNDRIFWKIDCYNLDQTAGSPNPANPAVTYRVLTIMLASEY
ncbi:DUF3768 domain-containing protein [Gymnodinialimonas ceratoperidinii]|uniref:DUF3768 domain-containing protein n=1 Tax=Gymnodinialimonas ceratoperidinii TaxID=2856823 RepID=A0A8F6YCA5_9RHOB|nr:DUF3768 domain-containing protein [Gymnodinialimonas ceratoperidinii]QXT41031.1 DUF3768 domain-containing protein [Gymnodinialimonas ceratoperidinii]